MHEDRSRLGFSCLLPGPALPRRRGRSDACVVAWAGAGDRVHLAASVRAAFAGAGAAPLLQPRVQPGSLCVKRVAGGRRGVTHMYQEVKQN